MSMLLRPISHNASKEDLLQQNIALRAEISLLRAQRDNAEAYAILSKQELDMLKLQESQKAHKSKPLKLDYESLTGDESRGRRNIRTAEHEAKAQEKTAAEKKQIEKDLEAVVKCATIFKDWAHIFSGSLKSKTKSELMDILTFLDLATNGTKVDFCRQILDYFESYPEQKESERFRGLFNPSRRGRLSRAGNKTEQDGTKNIPPTVARLPPRHHLAQASLPIPGPSRSHPQAYSTDHRYHPYPDPRLHLQYTYGI